MTVLPKLHIHNIYDALNPSGAGVNGHLKLRVVQIHDRVVAMADNDDILCVSADCPDDYIDYTLGLTKAINVSVLRFNVSDDLRKYINAHAVFESLKKDPHWMAAVERKPTLTPYIQSPSVLNEARNAGLPVDESTWKMVVESRLIEEMNDKGALYEACEEQGLPLPRYWSVDGSDLVDSVIDLLEAGEGPLYIRQTRSAGSIGNVTAEMKDGLYNLNELADRPLNIVDFAHILDHFAKSSRWHKFLITEYLELESSPSTLFHAGDDGVTVICHSEQVLSERHGYHGFLYPVRSEKAKGCLSFMAEATVKLIEPWRIQGYRGYGNIDWMISVEGSLYIAELNARQTATLPPLKIANRLEGTRDKLISAPKSAIVSRDKVHYRKNVEFGQARDALGNAGLLWEKRVNDTGVVIIGPPVPHFGLDSVGVMAAGHDVEDAESLIGEVIRILGEGEI